MKLAVLRVDGNFHDSYQDALYYLYGFVPVGGFVIFDDVFSHKGAMQAWNEFNKDHGLPEELTRIDIYIYMYIYIQAISERLVVSPWTSRKCGLHTCNMHNSAQHFREMRNMFVQDSADAGCLCRAKASLHRFSLF